MKKMILLLMSLLWIFGAADAQTTEREDRREARSKRRADRKELYIQQLDSMIRNGTFRFVPRTMQRQPAGMLRTLSRVDYAVTFDRQTIDIDLPYMTNEPAMRRFTNLRYSISFWDDYLFVRTKNGWTVRFDSSLYSSESYTFEFEITKRGNAVLTIRNPRYNPVQYEGSIFEIF